MPDNPVVPTAVVRIGRWSGFATLEEGDYRWLEQEKGIYKVWKWDGKRWRPRKRYPAGLLTVTRYDVAVLA